MDITLITMKYKNIKIYESDHKQFRLNVVNEGKKTLAEVVKKLNISAKKQGVRDISAKEKEVKMNESRP